MREYYELPPTVEEQFALEGRRASALRTRMERGDTLEWKGPSLFDDVLPPLPFHRSRSDDHRRPHESLLSASGPARSAQVHSLRLVEPLQTGVAWSQVWRCHGRRADASVEEPACAVVVKFLDEALFPYPEAELVSPEADVWDWWSADTLEDREGDAYAALRTLQGAELPICYGFYRFKLARGDVIIGIVLEDLTETTRPLVEHVERAMGLYSRDFAAADGLIRALFAGIRKMHDLEMADFRFQPSNILVLKSSPLAEPKLVFLDFGTTRSRSHVEARQIMSWEETRARIGDERAGERPGPSSWRVSDEYFIAQIAQEQMSEEMWIKWETGETENETLGLWYQSTSRD